ARVAELDRARATGDPIDTLIAGRALVDALTPDRAWSRTLEAREHALLVREAADLTPRLYRAGGVALHDRDGLRASLLAADRVEALARELAGSRPRVAPWDVLAWDEARGDLRAVDDSAGR